MFVANQRDPTPGHCLPCQPSPLRIAVIGCGPKGLFCLERLAHQLEQTADPPPLQITIFEPAEYLGAGRVYDPRQPSYLRMNFAAEHVNVWRCEQDGPSLLKWLSAHHPEFADVGQYVPRAIVGEYLNACWKQVLRRLGKCAIVHLVKQHVGRLTPDGPAWRIGSGDGGHDERFDEVLLTVGHEGWRGEASAAHDPNSMDVSCVYPTEQQLSSAAVPAGCRVAMRGIGLTAIDAMLALTEGRQGKFQRHGRRWQYQKSMAEPAVVYPYSRSGRPMLAKPVPQQMGLPKLDEIWERHCHDLRQLAEHHGSHDFTSQVWPVIIRAADAALRAVGAEGSGGDAVGGDADGDNGIATWFRQWCRFRPSAGEFREQVASSIQVATGDRSPDAAWALGEAWRRLYPSLVGVVSHDGLSTPSWPSFRRIASEMERIAFGPPVENCRKLLALVDAGIVDLSFLQGRVQSDPPSERRIQSASSDRYQTIDKHVSGRVPGPAQSSSQGPLCWLASNGHLSLHVSGSGYRINRRGQPINIEGRSIAGLTLIGRPTEGSVLGNDTLNPSLHDQPAGWANRIIRQRKSPIPVRSTTLERPQPTEEY